MTYFYAYDIPDNRRRKAVSTKLEQFGIRIQRSVFQCAASAELAENLKNALLRLIDEKEDSLYIIPLCEKDFEKLERFGAPVQKNYADGVYSIL
jgi:CRISPR-associated protein Cas2